MRKHILLILSLIVATFASAQKSGTCTVGENNQLSKNQLSEPLVAHFEDVELNESGYWASPVINESSTMESQGWSFATFTGDYSGYEYFSDFRASNSTNTELTGLYAQYTAVTGSGVNGSSNYAVAYISGNTTVQPTQWEPMVVSGCFVTNNLWTYQAILEGDGYSGPFGGNDGTEPDYLLLKAYGYNADGEVKDSTIFYLADYRFENSEEDYVVNDWQWFDLSTLGEVSKIRFSLEGSKSNEWGMTTPSYFCMDDFNGAKPLDIAETESKQNIVNIYPNPSNGIIYIKTLGKESTYRVFNTIGQQIMSGVTSSTATSINLSEFGSGLYIINISRDNETISEKVFIK